MKKLTWTFLFLYLAFNSIGKSDSTKKIVFDLSGYGNCRIERLGDQTKYLRYELDQINFLRTGIFLFGSCYLGPTLGYGLEYSFDKAYLSRRTVNKFYFGLTWFLKKSYNIGELKIHCDIYHTYSRVGVKNNGYFDKSIYNGFEQHLTVARLFPIGKLHAGPIINLTTLVPTKNSINSSVTTSLLFGLNLIL
ncbi:MAG: hypothetical protein KDC92_15815 [Bacteroidetes bacterium]|nr:hypothetical protein [Bacteroidota bacterium]